MRVARATGARRFQWSVPHKALASGQGFCNDSSCTTIPFGISVMRMTDIPNGIVVHELSLQKPCPEASALCGTDHWNLLAPVALATRMLSFLKPAAMSVSSIIRLETSVYGSLVFREVLPELAVRSCRPWTMIVPQSTRYSG